MTLSPIPATSPDATYALPSVDALDLLLRRIDGEDAALLVSILRERLDLYQTAQATVLAASMRTFVHLLEKRSQQRRASHSTHELLNHYMTEAMADAKVWRKFNGASRYPLEGAELEAHAKANARLEVLCDLASIISDGVKPPVRPPWAGVTPEDVNGEGDEDDAHCYACNGTGIGQSGDPDTSRCQRCMGKGVITVKDEE